ncbi:MAG: hypothetical protein ACLFV7_12365, partial [Phycisphaerae bacterium]
MLHNTPQAVGTPGRLLSLCPTRSRALPASAGNPAKPWRLFLFFGSQYLIMCLGGAVCQSVLNSLPAKNTGIAGDTALKTWIATAIESKITPAVRFAKRPARSVPQIGNAIRHGLN